MFKMDLDDNGSLAGLLYEVQALRQDVAEQTKLTEELLHKMNNIEDKLDNHEDILKELATTDTKAEGSIKEKKTKLKLFPIVSEKNLKEVENIVEHTQKERVIKYLKQELGNVKQSKLFSVIFTENMLLQVNWSGVKHKLPLNRCKFFTEYMFESLKTMHMSYDRFEDMMKRSLVLGKNSIYRKVPKKRIEN